MPGPGEPLFLEEDTAGIIALAEEERDTCQACGYPKAWCRDPANQFAFDAEDETCWATWRTAQRQEKHERDGMHSATRRATQTRSVFREGHLPPIEAGLDLVPDENDAS